MTTNNGIVLPQTTGEEAKGKPGASEGEEGLDLGLGAAEGC